MLWFVALLALLVSTAAPQAFASWQCEGRACGSSPWQCCCFSLEKEGGDGCSSEAKRAAHDAHAGVCPSSDCRCTLVVQATDTTHPSAPAGLSVPHFALAMPQPAPVVPAPLPTEKVARSVESRGPPGPLVALTAHQLRGPPSA